MRSIAPFRPHRETVTDTQQATFPGNHTVRDCIDAMTAGQIATLYGQPDPKPPFRSAVNARRDARVRVFGSHFALNHGTSDHGFGNTGAWQSSTTKSGLPGSADS